MLIESLQTTGRASVGTVHVALLQAGLVHRKTPRHRIHLFLDQAKPGTWPRMAAAPSVRSVRVFLSSFVAILRWFGEERPTPQVWAVLISFHKVSSIQQVFRVTNVASWGWQWNALLTATSMSADHADTPSTAASTPAPPPVAALADMRRRTAEVSFSSRVIAVARGLASQN